MYNAGILLSGDPNVEPLAPPTMEHPVTWEEQTYNQRWYLNMEIEAVSSKVNFHQIEKAFHHNYVQYIGLGMDLHLDLYNGTYLLTQCVAKVCSAVK